MNNVFFYLIFTPAKLKSLQKKHEFSLVQNWYILQNLNTQKITKAKLMKNEQKKGKGKK